MPGGGVCAVLDYEVDTMSEYVAEMVTRVVTPEATVSPPFRKFVTQILTSTRLPSTTILLGMNYLAKRMNAMKERGPFKTSEGQVWRYLTVSLLLGSKFLDDNTFQNRSWSEVSGIAVSELNALEFDWVQAMNWKLYVNLDLSKDYQAWLDNWREWRQMKKRQAARLSRDRLLSHPPATEALPVRPIKALPSPRSRYIQAQVAEYARYQTMKSQQRSYRPRDAGWGHSTWSAPLTPPDSGYGTPDYGTPDYSVASMSGNPRYNEWLAQTAPQFELRYRPPAPHNPGFYSTRQTPFVAHFTYHHNLWDRSLPECSCPSCLDQMKQTPYLVPHGYGLPVVG